MAGVGGIGSWWTLFRAGNSTTGVLGVFLGAVLALGQMPSGDLAFITALHALSVMCFMCSWNALNDYLDLEIDRINRPDRPIPSGAISQSSAKRAIVLILMLSLLSIAGAGAIASELEGGIEGWYPALVIWAGALLLLMNYESTSRFSLRLKERGLPGNIAIGLSVGMVVLFGAAGVFQPLHPRAWVAFLAGFLFNLAREIVKDVEDMEGDAGRETLAMKLSPDKARTIAWAILLITLVSILVPFAIGIFPELHLVGVIPSVVLLLMVKPKLFGSEDHAAQMLIKRSMQLCLVAFLASSLL
ncbi:MAG: geranylgeranylglycerol-phosphate geranylgeranyltransferase [Candidatus Thalassarchaeaceae archaeon]|nr:geranylgeranylglycerol-phosphate geranylgeranyltransferase [Candidatus Thalassarchaeaceae archaeon]MDP7092119.1 geranylgeranylglycerol-phosphate geranylgeranyltransferase [Candidatus Thalassarchaeaceae archaeon]MDP7446406.1 geranylgeranylglycerol-phosphate geranylgeranyltransferase [Candidatus Thalassarchaeaceae archaeon]MDP7649882.1 geranylgeranylglycerol-phosphate geranylgeranyltransferase [Candidatus Thalassarchaeaceae archaeon]HJL55510.1 geranylgeranylglycerol-phosphate geranylgeranyltra